jgi:hypothetical protein
VKIYSDQKLFVLSVTAANKTGASPVEKDTWIVFLFLHVKYIWSDWLQIEQYTVIYWKEHIGHIVAAILERAFWYCFLIFDYMLILCSYLLILKFLGF